MSDTYDISRIAALAGNRVPRVHYKATTESTNDDAIQLAKWGAPTGSVIITGEQTAGRGRRQSRWHAQRGETLCLSLIAEDSGGLPSSLIVGVAVAEAVQEFGVELGIKWPNDLYYRGKKVGGILVESVGKRIVVGLGLNLDVAEFPKDLEKSATCLRRAGFVGDVDELVGALLRMIMGGLLLEDPVRVLDELRRRCVLTGEDVTLLSGDQRLSGRIAGIGEGGALLLERDNKVEALISAEQIRVRSKRGVGASPA